MRLPPSARNPIAMDVRWARGWVRRKDEMVGSPAADGEQTAPGVIHPGMDAVAFLTAVQDRLGMAP